MFRFSRPSRLLSAAAGLILLAGCANTTPPSTSAAAGPQLSGAWYQVFFNTDGTEINARGQMIIQTVATVVKTDDQVRVTVIGHTDSVGSMAANGILSRQRADRVREALIASSIPADRIDTSWTGETQQNVATAANVAEWRNRVVDITVQHPYD
jgi:OOP family OmpA-OmpF porin